jgi:hypothetical protein
MGYLEFNNRIDALVMGRITFETIWNKTDHVEPLA